MSREDLKPMIVIIKSTGETWHGKFARKEDAVRCFTGPVSFACAIPPEDVEVYLEEEDNALLPREM